jgi:sugar phosphate isomerase/epimerase
LFTGQFADIPLEDLARSAQDWGYQGLELACWGEHLKVDVALGKETGQKYCDGIRQMLSHHGLAIHAISHHLAGQLVCDLNDDERSDAFAPSQCAGDPELKRDWAIRTMMDTAKVAKMLGATVVNGFTGSPIWHLLYSFPPVKEATIEEGYDFFIEKWGVIMEVYADLGVKFALEVHPTEIAYDTVTARRLLTRIQGAVVEGAWSEKAADAFGFNFDPSHLHWQLVDPVKFIRAFPDKIFHVHMKDAKRTLDGESGILGSHLNFGTPGRGWDFRSPGHGEIDFEEIIRALQIIGYKGPLSVEWEDAMMDRMHGAREACAFVKGIQFPKSDRVFDEAFSKK